jgi:Uncharacterized conserved protein
MNIFAGFLIGMLGSFHCIGMCGPIAIALPSEDKLGIKSLFKKFLYNLGRIISYGFMGGVFGLVGGRIKLFGYQQALSIILGVLILLFLFIPVKLKGKFVFLKAYQFYEAKIKKQLVGLLKSNTNSSFLFIGILNGFLPCGLVYIAIAGAIASDSVVNGILFMALFGLGTLPVMFATTIAGNFINLNIRRRITRLIPVFTFVFALIFILRGLNLGIPFVSPKLAKTTVKHVEVDCCH